MFYFIYDTDDDMKIPKTRDQAEQESSVLNVQHILNNEGRNQKRNSGVVSYLNG